MARYIDVDNHLFKCKTCLHYHKAEKKCKGNMLFCGEGERYYPDMAKIPIADVVEVKHGEWVDDIQKITTCAGVSYNGIVGYKCSLCGRREGSTEPYCNCGAKMDGERKTE